MPYRLKYKHSTVEQQRRFWEFVARTCSIAARCLLVLVIAFMGVSTAVFAQLAMPYEASAAGDDGQGGNTGSEDGDDEEGDADEEGEGEDPEDAAKVKSIEVRAYEMDDSESWVVPKNKKGVDTIATNGGRLRLCVYATWKDGSKVSEAQEESWKDRGAFASGFNYDWSGNKISIDPRGVVTALKDGETTIVVTPQEETYQGLSAEITITTANQGEGLIVKKIEILKENGKAYGSDTISMKKPNEQIKLYVRVTYRDKSDDDKKVVYSNYPKAPEEEIPEEGAFDNISWGVGDTNYATISNHDGVGYLKAVASAMTQVYVSISGGDVTVDEGMGKGVVFDVVGVKISNGKTVSNGNPADSLKVKVMYAEDKKKKVVSSKTYSISQFKKLGVITRTYTLTQGKGAYVTDRASGVPMASLLKDLDIDTGDISYFTLAANDGANPGKISARWLLRTTRYFLPNYDIGGSLQEKTQVPTMLALEDSWNSNTMLTGELNSGTRFRLVFGTGVTSDGQFNCDTSKSIKFINTITIVLKGAAPSKVVVTPTKKKPAEKEKPKKQAEKKPQKKVEDKGSGGGSGGGNEGGSGKGKGGGEGKKKGAAAKSVGGYTGGSSGGKTKEGPTDISKPKAVDAQTSWRIYQMMNKSKTDIATVFEDNPLAPFAIPAVALVLLLGIASRYARFRLKTL